MNFLKAIQFVALLVASPSPSDTVTVPVDVPWSQAALGPGRWRW